MKTAVTHIQEKLEALGIYTSTMKQIIEYAKNEEREQIMEAYESGTDWGIAHPEADEHNSLVYFNETYPTIRVTK